MLENTLKNVVAVWSFHFNRVRGVPSSEQGGVWRVEAVDGLRDENRKWSRIVRERQRRSSAPLYSIRCVMRGSFLRTTALVSTTSKPCCSPNLSIHYRPTPLITPLHFPQPLFNKHQLIPREHKAELQGGACLLTRGRARKARLSCRSSEGLAALRAPATTNEDVRAAVGARAAMEAEKEGWPEAPSPLGWCQLSCGPSSSSSSNKELRSAVQRGGRNKSDWSVLQLSCDLSRRGSAFERQSWTLTALKNVLLLLTYDACCCTKAQRSNCD